MNKADLIEVLSEKCGIIKKDTKEIVENLFDLIAQEFRNGNEITISGFGNFNLVTRSKRKCRNPRTGESIIVPERKTIKFNLSRKLKDSLN